MSGTHRVSLDAVVDEQRVPLALDRLSPLLRQLAPLDPSSLGLRVTDEAALLVDDEPPAYVVALRWRPEPGDDVVTYSLPAPRDEHEAALRLTVSRAAWESQGEPGTLTLALDAPVVSAPQPHLDELLPAAEADEPGEHALPDTVEHPRPGAEVPGE